MERAQPPDASRQGCELPGPVLLAKNSPVLARLPSGSSNLRELVPLPRELTALFPTSEEVLGIGQGGLLRLALSVRLGSALLRPDDELPALVDLDIERGSLASLLCLLQLCLQTLDSHSVCVSQNRESLLEFHHLQMSSFAIAVRTHANCRGSRTCGHWADPWLTRTLHGLCHGPFLRRRPRSTDNLDPTCGHLHGLPPATWHGKTSLQK